MRRNLIGALCVAAIITLVVLVVAQFADAQSPTPPVASPTPTATPKPTVVKRTVHKPRKTVHKAKRFTPWAQPTKAQVYTIIDVESDGWVSGVLHRRIFCESGYRWWANNGQYDGLGQFADETFSRGFYSMNTRKVRMVKERKRWRRVRIVKRWSDGRREVVRGHRVRQTVRVHMKGRIDPPVAKTHGWAQVRIMAEAIRGESAVNNSEWACR